MQTAFQFEKNGPVEEVLKEVQIPIPDVAGSSGMVRIKVMAVSLNPIDVKIMETNGGMSGAGWSMDFPFIPGYDISGVVDAVSDDVQNWKVGDEVFTCNWGIGKHDDETKITAGGLCQYTIVPASKLSMKPSNVSHEDAAAISLVGLTALQSINNLGVKEGTRLLILGGSGAVGTIAMQLAKARGAWVATTCSQRTKDYVVLMGNPDLIIDYNAAKWYEMSELTTGDDDNKIDAIFDAIGEEKGFEHSKNVLKNDGTGSFLSIANFDVGFNPTGHEGYKYASFHCLSGNKSQQDDLVQLIVDKKLKLQLDGKDPFTNDGVQATFGKQKSNKSMGKNVIVFS